MGCVKMDTQKTAKQQHVNKTKNKATNAALYSVVRTVTSIVLLC